MAHFDRIRDPGFWVALGNLLASEMELFDAHLAGAINGDGGGVWAPSSLIEIGGLGLKITGPFVVTSQAQLQDGAVVSGGNLSVSLDATVQGDLLVQSTLEVEGTSEFHDDVLISGGGDLSVSGDANVQGALGVTGAATLASASVTDDLTVGDDATVGGDLAVTGTSSFTGGVQFAGPATFTDPVNLNDTVALTQPLTPSGAGRVRAKVVQGADADTVYTIADAEVVLIPGGVLTADRVYTLSATGAATGDRIVFATRDTSRTVTVTVPSNVGEQRLLRHNQSTSSDWVEYTYMGSAWYITGIYRNP